MAKKNHPYECNVDLIGNLITTQPPQSATYGINWAFLSIKAYQVS